MRLPMKQFKTLTTVLLCASLVSGCSWFGGDEDDAAIQPAELVPALALGILITVIASGLR
jgi:hypothetical protein